MGQRLQIETRPDVARVVDTAVPGAGHTGNGQHGDADQANSAGALSRSTRPPGTGGRARFVIGLLLPSAPVKGRFPSLVTHKVAGPLNQ